jgi:hypothetical protein
MFSNPWPDHNNKSQKHGLYLTLDMGRHQLCLTSGLYNYDLIPNITSAPTPPSPSPPQLGTDPSSKGRIIPEKTYGDAQSCHHHNNKNTALFIMWTIYSILTVYVVRNLNSEYSSKNTLIFYYFLSCDSSCQNLKLQIWFLFLGFVL